MNDVVSSVSHFQVSFRLAEIQGPVGWHFYALLDGMAGRVDDLGIRNAGLDPAPLPTDANVDYAVELIEMFAADDNPFFLNVWWLVPHTPYEPAPEPRWSDTIAKGISEDRHPPGALA